MFCDEVLALDGLGDEPISQALVNLLRKPGDLTTQSTTLPLYEGFRWEYQFDPHSSICSDSDENAPLRKASEIYLPEPIEYRFMSKLNDVDLLRERLQKIEEETMALMDKKKQGEI